MLRLEEMAAYSSLMIMSSISRFFSDSEKLEILSSLQSLSAVQYPEVDTILKKLGAIFQIGLTDWIDVDFSRWGTVAENENRSFRQLKKAILENCEITFDYYNSTGESSKRNVHPYKLIYKDKAWYLFAFCLSCNENRLFRLSRIKNLILTEVHFSVKQIYANTIPSFQCQRK